MTPKEAAFLQKLRAIFKVEAAEHVQTITTGLLDLQKTPAAEEVRRLIETTFRAAHSLKGAARSVQFVEIESLSHAMENTLAEWKRQEVSPSGPALESLHGILNAIAGALSESAPTPAEAPTAPPPTAHSVPAPAPTAALPPIPDLSPSGPVLAPVRIPVPGPPTKVDRLPLESTATRTLLPAQSTVRVTIAKLDAQLLEAEEMLAAKLAVGQWEVELRELSNRFDLWNREWVLVEPQIGALRQTLDQSAAYPGLARLLEFVEWNHEHFKALERQVAELCVTARQDRHVIGRLVDDLLEDSKNLLLLPFATLAVSFPKLVHDLSRDQGKEAELVIHGETVEIDKRILEEMKDPFIHLLRNCVDHGVESRERREQLGKPARARITLTISPVNGRKVELLLTDDGAGIDSEKVKAAAINQGILSVVKADTLDRAGVLALVFQGDVSTRPVVTSLSGRGLGLAIVRERVGELGGVVSVESQPDKGTTFRIVLPLMRSTFRGILVRVADRMFILPTEQVARVARVPITDIQSMEGRETISWQGRALAWVRLAEVLGLSGAGSMDDEASAVTYVVLGEGNQQMAFAVDAVLDEQEVLVKPLRKPLSRVRNIAGATVLGSGQLVPVLNVADLLKSARLSAGAYPRREAANPVRARSLLVVEDSITARLLLKSILESAGYAVKTAVDGLEAFALLRTFACDLVVSDVDMPRLDGFGLTARIRGDRKLADLPVVLVTARETPEDRERGLDAGANAYLAKSGFDQTNLLETIGRLI